jgi:hypothetical protein
MDLTTDPDAERPGSATPNAKRSYTHMSKIRITIQALALVVFTLTFASLANAQATRTWVSGVGDDVNPCSRTAPCKTFAGAISKTLINGEIDALDPAGYGVLTATKSITVDGTGTLAGVLASGSPAAITINTTDVSGNDPLHNVTLRGLSLNGAGASGTVGTRTATNGIRVLRAANVWIEDCVVFNFTTSGLSATIGTESTNIHLKNSVFRDNGGDGVLATAPSGLFVRISADHCHFTGNGQNGVNGGANARISVAHCMLASNGNAGALARSLTAGLNAVVNVSKSEISNNLQHGVQAGGGAAAALSFVVVGDNTISGSGTDAYNIGVNGEIDTFGNNNSFGNNVNTCGGCVSISPANT